MMSSTPLAGEDQRHLVDGIHVGRGDDGFARYVAEQRDLFLDVVRDEALRAAQQNIGLDTDGAQFLYAVLGGLALELLRGVDPGDQRDVHEDHVVAALLVADLADGFQKRQRFDIAHRAADFDDDHIHIDRQLAHCGLDFVRDVRDHLHGFAQIIAAALARDDLFVDAAGGDVVGLREAGVREAFVVAQVEIGFGAVIRDEDLAVLEGAERAGIDIEVGVEFLAGDAQAAAFQTDIRWRRRRCPCPARRRRRRSRRCT